MQVCVWAAKSVHFHCQWSQIELNYLREDMLDDRSQSLHSLISLNEHPLQLSDGLLFLLRLLFTLILFCHGCSVCSGGLRCILWAVCGFVDGSGCRSCSSGARDTVDVFKICHWCHWCVTIQHIWHLKEIKVKALRSVSVFFFIRFCILKLKNKKKKGKEENLPGRMSFAGVSASGLLARTLIPGTYHCNVSVLLSRPAAWFCPLQENVELLACGMFSSVIRSLGQQQRYSEGNA